MSPPGDPRSRKNVRQARFAGQRHTTSTKHQATGITKVTRVHALSSYTLCLSRKRLQRSVDTGKRTLSSEQHEHIEHARTHARPCERDAQRLK